MPCLTCTVIGIMSLITKNSYGNDAANPSSFSSMYWPLDCAPLSGLICMYVCVYIIYIHTHIYSTWAKKEKFLGATWGGDIRSTDQSNQGIPAPDGQKPSDPFAPFRTLESQMCWGQRACGGDHHCGVGRKEVRHSWGHLLPLWTG